MVGDKVSTHILRSGGGNNDNEGGNVGANDGMSVGDVDGVNVGDVVGFVGLVVGDGVGSVIFRIILFN